MKNEHATPEICAAIERLTGKPADPDALEASVTGKGRDMRLDDSPIQHPARREFLDQLTRDQQRHDRVRLENSRPMGWADLEFCKTPGCDALAVEHCAKHQDEQAREGATLRDPGAAVSGRPRRLAGHKLTMEWSGERGEESSSTGECPCGWSESGSSQSVVRDEYAHHLDHVWEKDHPRPTPAFVVVSLADRRAWSVLAEHEDHALTLVAQNVQYAESYADFRESLSAHLVLGYVQPCVVGGGS